MSREGLRAVRGFLSAAGAIIFLTSFVIWVGIAHATVSSNVATSLTVSGFTIKASSTPVTIISLNLAGDQTLASTSIAFLSVSGFSTTTDLAALSSATSSGVAVYRDNKFAGTYGSFDSADYVIPLLMASTSWTGSGGIGTTTLTFATPEVVPADDTSFVNQGADYFIVIQTANPAGFNGHSFTANMYPNSNGWTGAQPTGPIALTTNTITGDTVAPLVFTNTTGPINNSTGVSVSTFVHMGFNENLDQTTLNLNTITFTQNGSPVGAAIKPFPNGFDVISSSPPTYAVSSRFAKAATTSTGFFFVNGTDPIGVQGGYTSPSIGDIVYTQTDTFPPEVGVVTNNTLISGSFKINNFALFRPSQVTKFSTPTASGQIAAAANTGVGDLIVANINASSTDVRYSWHIVTTAAAINNTSLRLDGASGAPTYATTTFARLMPAATSTTNASALLTATTTFSAGDLVFAKLSKGGDNIGTYAWHLVTTAETVNAPSGAGTPTVLTLDSSSATTSFTASTVIAKITSAAQGAIDSGAQNATPFSIGDLMFAKATAGASNLNSYNFHLVSNPATGATSTSLRLDNAQGNLNPSSTYVVTVSPGVKDFAGNAFAATSTLTFTTSSTTATNVTPPFIQSSQPQQGAQSFPPNGKLNLIFSVAMKSDGGANAVNNTAIVKLSNAVNGAPVTATSTSLSYDSTTNTLTVTPSNVLQPNTDMILQVLTTAQSTTNTPLPQEYRLYYRTASSTDTTAPTVLGVNPTSNSTSISLSQVFTAGLSKDMDPSTVSSTTVKLLAQIGGASVAGNVSYSPQQRSIVFAPSTALSTATGYTFRIGAGLTGPADLSGNRLTATSTSFATTTATADTTKPIVSFASVDNFGIAITYSETVRTGGAPDSADNIANYTLESPVGTTISLGGKTVTYDAMTKTARISGLSLSGGSQFKVTVGTNVQDLAVNSIDTSGSPAGNLAFGSVQFSSATGGNLGPGMGTIDQSIQGMNPTQLMPMTRLAGATSAYILNFLAGTSIPSGGQIVVTFPSGFDITNASTTATSMCNADINGQQFAGVPTITSITNNAGAGTVTITTSGDATGANAFICIELSGIVNSTVPSSSGYTGDIKTRDTVGNNRAILETKTTAPFFLGAAGTLTLTVNVFNDANANSTINTNEGIGNVRVFLFSPAIGGNSATTSTSGVATFGSLVAGDYMVGIDPGSLAAASTTVSFNSAPQPFAVSATNLTKNVIVSGSGSTFTISGTISGPSGTSVDVFAGGSSGFSKKTVPLTSGPDSYSLSVAANATYQVGVGPAMPEAFFTPGAPPPPMPTFNFMPPPPISVTVGTSSVTGKNFTLALTNKTITGTVLDKNGSAVSNAGVFARPVSTSTSNTSSTNGFGTGGMTNTSGAFSLNVTPGTYLVGAVKPGMPSVSDQQIVVPSSGLITSPASLAFTIGVGSTLTISGTVKDDSGNAIPYAGVAGRKVNSTSDMTAIGGTEGNFVGGPTDANGAYTLYVTNGTWVVEAYGPGFGKLGSKTITVSGSSLSGQDFSAQTLTLGTITGTTTKDSVTQQGVIVRAEGLSGTNQTVSDSSGVYTLKVPVGTGYTVHCVFPGVGEGTPLSNVAVIANTTSYSNNCAMAAPITVTVKLTDGTNPITGAFVDARTSSGFGNNTNAYTTSGANAIYTLTLPPGTYTVRAGHPSYGMIGSTASVSLAQTITYTATAGQLYTISGSVTNGSSALSSAWVSIFGTPTGQSNTVNMGAQTDSNGAFSIKVPPGSYSIRADKPGYISGTPTSVTITNTNKTADTIVLTTASLTISGSVTLSGTGVSGAFVDASDASGGFTVAQTDSNGAYSLAIRNGGWTIHAHSIGYQGTESVSVNGASQSVNIALSAISGFTVYPEKQETVTPTAGGLLTNSDIGSAFKVNIPANALGTGSNAGTVSTQSNTGVPNTSNGTVLSKNAVTISAVDSSGQPIKNLNDSVTIVIPYTESDLPSGTSESSLQIGVWNDSTLTYDMLPTTVDTTNNTLTTTVSHFSDFAPVANSGAVVAATAASTVSSGGGGGVPGSVANTGPAPRAQIVYPDGRVVYVDQIQEGPKALAATEVATSVSGGTSLGSVKFIILLKQGSTGSDVKRLQQLLGIEAAGIFGQKTRAAVEAFQIKYKIAAKGDQGFGQLGPKTRTKLNELFGAKAGVAAPQASAQGQAQSRNAAISVGTFVRALNLHAKGDDVKTLQIVLNMDPDTRIAASGDGSLGKETTIFGVGTLRAVKTFQLKYGLSKQSDSGFGNVGPKTRAKLIELLQSLTAGAQSSSNSSTATSVSVQTTSASTTPVSTSASSTPTISPASTTPITTSASTTVSVSASTTISTGGGY